MDKMTKYICAITGNESTQKSHHTAHLRTKTYKLAKQIKKLELEKLSEDELLEKYGEKKIDLILKNLETVVIKNMPVQTENYFRLPEYSEVDFKRSKNKDKDVKYILRKLIEHIIYYIKQKILLGKKLYKL